MTEHMKITLLSIAVCFSLLIAGCTSSRYWGEGYRVWELRLHKDEKLRELKAKQAKKEQVDYEHEKNRGPWLNLPNQNE